MSKLEDLRTNASVKGILPDALVTVVSTQWYGSEALELTYKTAAGRVANELLYRHDEPRIEVVEQGRPWSFDGDGAIFRLVSEAYRIRLAHLFDPLLAAGDQPGHEIAVVLPTGDPREGAVLALQKAASVRHVGHQEAGLTIGKTKIAAPHSHAPSVRCRRPAPLQCWSFMTVTPPPSRGSGLEFVSDALPDPRAVVACVWSREDRGSQQRH